MKTEIRFAGFGGQGIILAGVILGEGAILDGKNAVQTQSYGPESRGGAARSEVVISDDEIDYPAVIEADYLVVLSQPGYDKYGDEVKPGSTVVIDQNLVDAEKHESAGDFYRLPFAKIADNLGNRIVMNIVMLGAVCAITKVVDKEKLLEAVKARVPKKFLDLNVKAFNEGFKVGTRAVKGGGKR
jgi:2-oxoglutarate ferredoxin oxidoreductase subunit gamma